MTEVVAANRVRSGSGFAAVLDAEYRSLERLNERRAARFAVLLGIVGTAAAVWVALMLDARLGWTLSAFGVAVIVYYWQVLPRLLERVDKTWILQVVNVSVEVSLPAIISLVDIVVAGGAYAVTSTPRLLTFVVVIGSGLRLKRSLSIYAGFLGAVEYGTIYALARPDISADLLGRLPSLGWGFTVMHMAYLVCGGFLAALVAHVGKSMSRRVAMQIIEKEHLGDLFGEYVSPRIVERVRRGEISLTGERRTVTILFADIRDFTPLAFGREPEAVVNYLNEYFRRVCEVIARHDGMVNKFIGDGVLAVFGAPDDDPDHALHAARAALEMVAATSGLLRPDGDTTRIGVGLHTGQVVLGSIGGARRKDYTVIGDVVNTAARIESLTKNLGCPVLASKAAVEAAGTKGLEVESLGQHDLKGRARPEEIFRLIGAGRSPG